MYLKNLSFGIIKTKLFSIFTIANSVFDSITNYFLTKKNFKNLKLKLSVLEIFMLGEQEKHLYHKINEILNKKI